VNLLLGEVARATERLAEAGVASPRYDAEELAAAVHGVRRGELHTVADADFDPTYWTAVARRAAREPLQHLTGRAYFRYLELAVGPGVFIPRQETEVVTGWAIDALRAMDVAEPLVVDLCTGSGAIALAIAQEVPRSRVHAVEADPTAAKWARKNVTAMSAPAPRDPHEGHPQSIGPSESPPHISRDRVRATLTPPEAVGPRRADAAGSGRAGRADAAGSERLEARVTLHRADVAGCLPELAGQVDLVISNPPYVPLGATIRDPEVAEYDPPQALWSGKDGLDMIRIIEATARRLLREDGLAVVEHADEQWGSAPAVFREEYGWTDVRDHRDLAAKPRFLTARHRPT
jgi:release factor glutamine methyltransferase